MGKEQRSSGRAECKTWMLGKGSVKGGGRRPCGHPRERPQDDGIQEKEASVVTCGAITYRPVGREGAVRSHELVPT